MIIERSAPDVETRTRLAAPERDGAVTVRNQVDDELA